MAYDQSYYQPPSRPYNGSAARPPAAPQHNYPPPTTYAAQGPYDQYSHDDGYGGGYDEYGDNGGYADQGYDNGYQQAVNGGGRGGGPGRGYPPASQGYAPQQQDYYDASGPQRGGGDPRHQGRDGRPNRGGASHPGRAPPPDGGRGAYDSRGSSRGYSNGNGPRSHGRGGRPPPLNRNGSTDPGSQPRFGAPPKMSPHETSWDNPFPTVPNSKKKPSRSKDHNLVGQMSNMNMNDGPRPRTGGGSNGHERRGPPGTDRYGRPMPDSQRPPPSRSAAGQYQPGHSDQGPGRGPGPGPGPALAGAQRANGYGSSYDSGYGASETMPISPIKDNFGPPSRANTMPNEMNMNAQMGNVSANGFPAQPSVDSGPSAPYSGPVGRMPPRPSTATGVRPIPQRTYPSQAPQQPAQLQPPQQEPFGNDNNLRNPNDEYSHHSHTPSISNIYDDYYHSDDGGNGRASVTSDPGAAGYGRGAAREGQMQQINGYPTMNHQRIEPDFRAQVQPQSAVYEMVGDAPPVPHGNPQGYQNERYDQYGSAAPVPPLQAGQRGPPNAAIYSNAPSLDGRNGGSASRGPPPGLIPGPAPYRAVPGPTTNGGFQGPSPAGPEGLPTHPPPIRAGLSPNPAPLTDKPAPVRNYNSNQPAVVAPQRPPQNRQPAAPSVAAAPPPVTVEEIERLRVMVKANPTDQTSALLLARKLVEASEIIVPKIPEPKARNKARERYIIDVHKILKKLCSVGNATPTSPQAEAMFFFADCLGRGCLGGEPDNKEAFTLYQNAAKAGHAAAAYRTAVCCELGQEEGGGTRKDPLKAIQWYKRAATLGDTPAMYKMGMIQLKGLLGQPKNPNEAIIWLKQAADKADAENPHALHELGLLYESNDNNGAVIRDEAYALSLFRQAAELGYKFSQFRLGCAYEYGLFNLPVDPRQSISWYSKAAVQEEHQSELALSGWYLTGSEGVLQQSDTEAYLWARKAAMAGLTKAEYAMGYFTEVGIGAPADLEGAKRWYWRAAAQNFPKARERLEDLKRGGNKPQLKGRERISRSKIGKQNEGECAVM